PRLSRRNPFLPDIRRRRASPSHAGSDRDGRGNRPASNARLIRRGARDLPNSLVASSAWNPFSRASLSILAGAIPYPPAARIGAAQPSAPCGSYNSDRRHHAFVLVLHDVAVEHKPPALP